MTGKMAHELRPTTWALVAVIPTYGFKPEQIKDGRISQLQGSEGSAVTGLQADSSSDNP